MLMQEFHNQMTDVDAGDSPIKKLISLTKESLDVFFEEAESATWSQWSAV